MMEAYLTRQCYCCKGQKRLLANNVIKPTWGQYGKHKPGKPKGKDQGNLRFG